MPVSSNASPPDDANRSLRIEGECAPKGWASATEQLRELALILLVLRQHRLQIARHDLEQRHRRIALRRRHIGKDWEIALRHRLLLRLLGKLPGHEGLRSFHIAAGLEHGDWLCDGGHAFLRKDELDWRAFVLGVEGHVFDDDAVGLFAARDRFDHSAIALAGNGAVLRQRFEIAPAELRLLHHRADMDDGGPGIEWMRENGLGGGLRDRQILPRLWRARHQLGIDDDPRGDQLGAEKRLSGSTSAGGTLSAGASGKANSRPSFLSCVIATASAISTTSACGRPAASSACSLFITSVVPERNNSILTAG